MKSFLNKNRKFFQAMGMVVAVSVLGYLYYGYYIPERQDALIQRKFRALDKIGGNIQEKIIAYKGLLGTKANEHTQSMRKEIPDAVFKGKIFPVRYQIKNGKDTLANLFNPIDPLVKIDPSNIIFYAKGTSSEMKLRGVMDLDSFITPLLWKEPFEGYFILDSNKIILNKLNIACNQHSLITQLKKDTGNNYQMTVTIAGIKYRLFQMPLNITAGSRQILLCALMKESVFQEQSKAVQPYILMSITFLLIFLLILLPFFKLWVLGKKDRLNLSDVAAITVSAFVMVAVCTLWFMKYSETFFSKGHIGDEVNNSLVTQVENNITREFDDAKKALETFEKTREGVYKTKIFDDDGFKNISHLFYGHPNGISVGTRRNHWGSFAKVLDEKPDLKQRNYFKVIKSSKSPTAVITEPIVTLVDGTFAIAFIKKFVSVEEKKKFSGTEDTLLIGICIQPKCFQNPVLPKGTKIALLDASGNVVLHSDSTKNLNENLLTELNYDKNLKATLDYNTTEHFRAEYADKEFRVMTKPLPGYPYFVVVMSPTEFRNEIDAKVCLFTASLASAVLILIFLFAYVWKWSQERGSIRKGAGKSLAYLYPTPRAYKKYLAYFGTNIALCLTLFAIYSSNELEPKSFISNTIYWFCAVSISLVLHYLIFSFFPPKKPIVPNTENPEPEPPPSSKHFALFYSGMVFTVIFLLSFFPVWLFYSTSFQYYDAAFRQSRLYEFANDWLAREHNEPQRASTRTFVYHQPFKVSESDSGQNEKATNENPLVKCLFTFFDDNNSYFSKHNYHFENISPPENITLGKNKASYFVELENENTVLSINDPQTYHFIPTSDKYHVFWLYFCFIAVLVVVFLLIHYGVRKIFGTDLPDIPNQSDDLANLLSVSSKSNFIFVQGLTGGDKYSEIIGFLKESFEPKSICTIDLIDIPDNTEGLQAVKTWADAAALLIQSESHKAFILTHFEYNFLDAETNQVKLNLIEKVSALKEKKVVIISSIESTGFLKSLEEIGEIKHGTSDGVMEDIIRWNVLLGKFVHMVIPLSESNEYQRPSTVGDLLQIETRATHFLKRIYAKEDNPDVQENNHIKVGLESEMKLYPEEKDRQLILLHQKATHYYRDVWQSLTPEEKIMVFDLAEEGLLNTTNYLTLYALLQKGVVLRSQGIFRLMNKSFRHYVLTTIDKDEIERAGNQINESSVWNDFQMPVLVLIAAMIWFVLYSNKDQFGQVFPIITALATGLPTLIKLFSYFIPEGAKSGT